MSVYKEEILDHFKNPRNFGKISKMDKIVKLRNSHCGDVIKMGVKIKNSRLRTSKKIVEEVRFEGEGCAISVASASMLTEMIKGKSLKELKNSRLRTSNILERLGIPISSARKKCATLGLEAWQKLLKKL